MARRRKPNRGVVLLVVISLLVLFVLIAVTYAMVAGQFRSAARLAEQTERRYGEPDNDLDKAFYVLLRDTKFKSTLQGHALLTDLYGPGSRGRVSLSTNPVTVAQGQFIRLFFDGLDTSRNSTGVSAYNNRRFRSVAGVYNGRVLTMLSGNANGLSTRIVAYIPPTFDNMGNQTAQGEFRVEAFESDGGGIVSPSAGDLFYVNGGAFNGCGAGYSAVTGNIDQVTWDPGPDSAWGNANNDDNNNGTTDDVSEAGWPGSDDLALPVVLLPNFSAHLQQSIPPLFGNANEPYDTPNYNDMILASVPPTSPVISIPTGPNSSVLVNRIFPSFHRPDLCNYWFQFLAGSVLSSIAAPQDRALVFQFPYGISNDRNGTDVDLRPLDSDGDGLADTAGPAMNVSIGIRDQVVRIKRMFMMRPLNELNPGFAQANPGFMRYRILGNGNLEWNFTPDVDTDGDGIKDSVWVDPGFPPTTGKDGRRFKTMIAVKCEDLDGRLNLNACGSYGHTATAPFNWGPMYPQNTTAGSGGVTNALAHGVGTGPADINISPFFQTEILNFLQARYGADTVPGATGNDALSAFKAFEMDDNFYNSTAMTSSHASPPDVWGRAAFALDHFGQPQFFWNMGTGEAVDDPYELNLAHPNLAFSGGDAPFTPAELERLLRWSESSAADLPNRLANLAPIAFNYGSNSAINRRLVTSSSYHIPVVNAPFNNLVVNNNPIRQTLFSKSPFADHSDTHVLQLYAQRLLSGGVIQANLVTELAKIVPTEILHGELFDINRPIGNGLDDFINGVKNGVVDEPLEGLIVEGVWNSAYPPYNGQATVNRLNDDPVLTNAMGSRQIIARHLYCLAMLLKNDGVEIDFNGDTTDDSPLETAYGLAQWAVNVVDFRDSDSIMTPFEFDIEPFQNGWNVNGLIGVDDANASQPDDNQAFRGLVWGCERPELLLSENLAFHDRRTQDLTVPSGRTTDPMNPDSHFDQRLRPRGAFFVELYNPWTAGYKRPAELYSTALNGVVLNGRVNGNGSPIWRLVVVKGNSLTADLDSPDPNIATPVAVGDIERTIYFTNPGAVLGPGGQYYTSNAIPMAPILPGRYGVIGPAGEIVGNPLSYVTTIGRTTTNANSDNAGVANTRRIILTPNNNPNIDQVTTANMIPPPGNPPVNSPVKPEPVAPGNMVNGDRLPAVAIIVDTFEDAQGPRPLPLSVSEPVGGYTAANFQITPGNPEGEYIPPIDEPLDWLRENNQLRTNQTIASFRMVHLQRLADPTQLYDAVANPYRTIDSMHVNLTAFNGVATGETSGATRFHSFQHGDSDVQNPYPYLKTNDPLAPVVGDPTFSRVLWRHEPPTIAVPGAVPSSDGVAVANLVNDHVYQFGLRQSLGYLNHNYWPYLPDTMAPNANYRGAPDATSNSTNNINAFPWLTWNNRPFTNPMELMMVPWTRSSRLLTRFPDVTITPTLDPYTQPYIFADPANPKPSHLLNFFHSQGNNSPSHLYRMFDYLTVRSPFVGTEKWYFPGLDLNGDGDNQDNGEYPGFGGLPSDPFAATFRPPYNRLSRFREPGRINLNTVAIDGGFSPVLSAALADLIDPGNVNPASVTAAINNIQLSRQGIATPGGGALYDTSLPSMFSNPFRPESVADMMPAIGAGAYHMRRDGQGAHQAPIDATMLRRNLATPTPLFDNTGTSPYADSSRNAFFKFQGHTKVNNLFTTHSNVYAVWITVGYFELEADPSGVSQISPDGFRLGREVGSESGNVKRHRAFYMVDRSIPVAYETGENHNVDRCVLLRRVIE